MALITLGTHLRLGAFRSSPRGETIAASDVYNKIIGQLMLYLITNSVLSEVH